MQARAAMIAKDAAKRKIAAYVAEAKLAPTTIKVATLFGLVKVTAATYLRQLEDAGEIHRVELAPTGARRSGKLPVIWVPGKSADFIPKEERLDPLITLRQKVVRTYALNHKRDPLVAALFGAAQQ